MIARLTPVLKIWETSRFYQNRGDTVLGRVYLTVDTSTPPDTPAPDPASPSIRVPADRADRDTSRPQIQNTERTLDRAAEQKRGPA